MQYINDDMDELFRRAAEDYPLNTNNADWNSVLKKLSENSADIKPGNKRGNKKYSSLLLLLLILPVIWIGKEYFYSSNNAGSRISMAQHNSNNKLSSSKAVIAAPPMENRLPGNMVRVVRDDNSAFVQLVDQKNNVRRQKASLRSVFDIPPVNNNDISGPANSTTDTKSESKQAPINNDVVIAEVKSNKQNNTVQQDDSKDENNKTVLKDKNKKQKEHGIYAGIMVSPDISTIKFQGIRNMGVSAGVIVGYQVNKNIDVETGLAWNEKYYHSDGKYFNAKNIVLPTYAKVKELDGTCKMIEVPVTVRYNFRRSSKGNLSVSGGLSSYIMKRENYDYTIERNGVQYPRNAGYKNSSTDMFAVANAGFAYNRNIGKKTILRVEPYIKIPVKGVGIGDLPIMSTGINIAVTKKISR